MSKELENAFKKALSGALYNASSPQWATWSVLPTGIPALDRALGGGFAYGTLSELFGDWGVGKTMLLYLLLAQNQKLGGTSVLFESEGAFYPEFFAALGGNPKTLLLKPIRTVEEFFDGVYKLLTVMKQAKAKGKKDVCVMGWDSLAGTGTEHLQKTWAKGEKKQDMSKARRMSEGCALITQMVDETNAMVVATNQLRVNIGAADWERPHTPGGKGWPFHSSQRIELNFDGGPVGSQIHYEEGEGKKVHIGRKVRGEIIKNRIAPPFRKFTMPLYTEAGYPHPLWQGEETKLGVDVEESTWNWISDPRSTFAVRNEEGTVVGRKRFCTSSGSRWNFAEEITAFMAATGDTPPSFFKKDFKQILPSVPQILMAHYDPSRLCAKCFQFTPPPEDTICDPCKTNPKRGEKKK